MNNELIIKTHSGDKKVFLQNGFYLENIPTNNVHKHNHAEIHIIGAGNAQYLINGTAYTAKSGTMLLIPGGMFHCCELREEKNTQTAFQIDTNIKDFTVCELNTETVLDFFSEIKKCSTSNDYTKVSAYISLFYTYLKNEKPLLPQEIIDYGFLIHEFISNNYSKDIHLCDLADELHISERHAERLVTEYTGKSFREEIVSTRMTVAKHLIKNSAMSLNEIAEYVGYHSYAGFWKAMKKYGLC